MPNAPTVCGRIAEDMPAVAARTAAGARVADAKPRLTARGLSAGTKLQDVSFGLQALVQGVEAALRP